MTISTANCNCIEQMNADIKEQIGSLYELPVQGFIRFDGGPATTALCIPLLHTKSKKPQNKPYIQAGFCPFCGTRCKTEEEVVAIHNQTNADKEAVS